MATAEISETFYPDGTARSLTMRVTCDIIDSRETIADAIHSASEMWKTVDPEPDS